MNRFVSHPSSLWVLLGLLLPISTGCNDAKEASFQAALAKQNELLTSQQQQVAEQNELLTSQQQQMQQMTATIEQLRADNQRAQARLAEAANQRPEIKVQPEIRLRPTIEYQPPPRKEVDLIIHSVSVYPERENGSPWDESGPPDLKVRIVGGSAGTFTTSTQRDTTYAMFNVKATRVAEGDEIQVEVLDNDVFIDDTIGTFTKKITAATMQSGTVNWTFDRVASLVLEFQP